MRQLFVAAILFAGAAQVSADTIFSEDFEAYAPGSFLVGQGGWVRHPAAGSGNIRVSTGTNLPSKALDGTNGPDSNQHILQHALPSAIDPSLVTILSFDSYAGSLASHNSGVLLAGEDSFNKIGWTPDIVRQEWRLYITLGSLVQFWHVPGGAAANYFRPGYFEVVLDGVANEVFGRYDLGSGLLETPHYGVTDSELAVLSRVQIDQDFRGVRGVDLDNILVQTQVVPEPGTYALLATVIVLLAASRVRRGRP